MTFQILPLSSQILDIARNIKPQPITGFGKLMVPLMIQAKYKNNEWGKLEILPYQSIQLDPCAKVLHYGQEIFEGLKSYQVGTTRPLLFRIDQNYNRFNRSATRLAMPELPASYFYDAINTIVALAEPMIPKKSGHFLYIRPFMFASEPHLGIAPSQEFIYIVVASPTESYLQGEVKVLIERKHSRACPGGTGHVKVGGNYAAGLISALRAKGQNLTQSMWLDSKNHRYIEELSGMNFFAVINNELYTPTLTETLLPGITRDSILTLAKSLNINVHEQLLDINELLTKIESGECQEAFACGTAATVSPLASLHEEEGKEYVFKNKFGPITKLIREELLNIQEGRKPAPADGWVFEVPTINL